MLSTSHHTTLIRNLSLFFIHCTKIDNCTIHSASHDIRVSPVKRIFRKVGYLLLIHSSVYEQISEHIEIFHSNEEKPILRPG